MVTSRLQSSCIIKSQTRKCEADVPESEQNRYLQGQVVTVPNKKNLEEQSLKTGAKCGIGIAALSLTALIAAIPVFSDVKTTKLEKNDTVLSYDSEGSTLVEDVISDAEKPADASAPEENSVYKVNPEESENLAYYNPEEFTYADPEEVKAEPEDYDYEPLRLEAEKYQAQGFILEDCKILAENVGVGLGSRDIAFVNGFTVYDKADGNNEFFIQVVRASENEWNWYVEGINNELEGFTASTDGSVTTLTSSNQYESITITYDSETELMVYDARFSGGLG